MKLIQRYWFGEDGDTYNIDFWKGDGCLVAHYAHQCVDKWTDSIEDIEDYLNDLIDSAINLPRTLKSKGYNVKGVTLNQLITIVQGWMKHYLSVDEARDLAMVDGFVDLDRYSSEQGCVKSYDFLGVM